MSAESGNPKEHELICVAASLAAGCVPCTQYHARAVRRTGATDEEIHAAAALGLAVKQAALETMARRASEHLGLPAGAKEVPRDDAADPLTLRAGLAAGAAANCAPVLRERLETATRLGLEQDHIDRALQVGRFIREQAARHADALCAPEPGRQAAAPCCGPPGAPAGPARPSGGVCG